MQWSCKLSYIWQYIRGVWVFWAYFCSVPQKDGNGYVSATCGLRICRLTTIMLNLYWLRETCIEQHTKQLKLVLTMSKVVWSTIYGMFSLQILLPLIVCMCMYWYVCVCIMYVYACMCIPCSKKCLSMIFLYVSVWCCIWLYAYYMCLYLDVW